MASTPEFTVKQAPVLVKSFGGCGVQLNQHVFAKQSLAFLPQASSKDPDTLEALKADLKAKIAALAPHCVRIFHNNDQEGVSFDKPLPRSAVNKPQGPLQKVRWNSFVEVVALANELGAEINTTCQAGPFAATVQK